jgi:hypothetical protein
MNILDIWVKKSISLLSNNSTDFFSDKYREFNWWNVTDLFSLNDVSWWISVGNYLFFFPFRINSFCAISGLFGPSSSQICSLVNFIFLSSQYSRFSWVSLVICFFIHLLNRLLLFGSWIKPLLKYYFLFSSVVY